MLLVTFLYIYKLLLLKFLFWICTVSFAIAAKLTVYIRLGFTVNLPSLMLSAKYLFLFLYVNFLELLSKKSILCINLWINIPSPIDDFKRLLTSSNYLCTYILIFFLKKGTYMWWNYMGNGRKYHNFIHMQCLLRNKNCHYATFCKFIYLFIYLFTIK